MVQSNLIVAKGFIQINDREEMDQLGNDVLRLIGEQVVEKRQRDNYLEVVLEFSREWERRSPTERKQSMIKRLGGGAKWFRALDEGRWYLWYHGDTMDDGWSILSEIDRMDGVIARERPVGREASRTAVHRLCDIFG